MARGGENAATNAACDKACATAQQQNVAEHSKPKAQVELGNQEDGESLMRSYTPTNFGALVLVNTYSCLE